MERPFGVSYVTLSAREALKPVTGGIVIAATAMVTTP